MQTANILANKDTVDRGRLRCGVVEMKAYQVNRQEGGLLSDIKGEVGSRPRPSEEAAG